MGEMLTLALLFPSRSSLFGDVTLAPVTAEHPGTMDERDYGTPPLGKVTAEFAADQAGGAGHQYSEGGAVPCRACQWLMI